MSTYTFNSEGGSFQRGPTIAQSNIEPVGAPPPPPPAAPGFRSLAPPSVKPSAGAIIFRATGGLERGTGIVPPVSSKTGAQGPAPGGISSGAPPSASSGAMSLATLPPAFRTIIKLAPFVAAGVFYSKGDTVLAAVAAAAGVGALLYL